MNKSKNKKTIRLRDEVPADFDTQRLESDLSLLKSFDKGLELEKENTRALLPALPGGRKNCRECREEEEEYYPEAKIEQREVRNA